MKRMRYMFVLLMLIFAFLLTWMFWELNKSKENEILACFFVFISIFVMFNGALFSNCSDQIRNIRILSLFFSIFVYVVSILISLNIGFGFVFFFFILISDVIYTISVVGIINIDKYPSVLRK